MKRKLKLIIVLLIILLVSLISFAGIYVKEKNHMESILPEYLLGMDLTGYRSITLELDNTTQKKIYDKDGNLLETNDENEKNEENTVKEEPINNSDNLNEENYSKTKSILEKRLDEMGVVEYRISQNKEDGKIFIQVPETTTTDLVQEILTTKGKFELTSTEDGKVLLGNEDIKKAELGYSSTDAGTTVVLNIRFTKEASKKLQDISKEYVTAKDSDGNDISKNVTMKIDDTTIMETSFSKEIADGSLQLSIGQASTSNETIQSYLAQAARLQCLLDSGEMPLIYTTDENVFVASDIKENIATIMTIIAIVSLAIIIVLLTIFYKKRGLLSGISLIGYLAVLLLVIRYTNVILTIEGLTAIALVMLLNSLTLWYVLKKQKLVAENEEFKQGLKNIRKKILWSGVPGLIISVVLCFSNWLPIYSFGMIMFWGWLIMILYHEIITKTMLVNLD